MLHVSLSQSIGHKEFDRLPYEALLSNSRRAVRLLN